EANLVAWQPNYALDERLTRVLWVPEDHNVATFDRLKLIDKFVDEDSLAVMQLRQHACALYLYRLYYKDHNQQCRNRSKDKIARQGAYLCKPYSRTRWLLFR